MISQVTTVSQTLGIFSDGLFSLEYEIRQKLLIFKRNMDGFLDFTLGASPNIVIGTTLMEKDKIYSVAFKTGYHYISNYFTFVKKLKKE